MDDEKDLDLDQQKKQKQQPKGNIVDKAANAKNTVETGQKVASGVSKLAKTGKLAENAAKVAETLGKVSTIAASLAPIIAVAAIIIVAIILVVGIVTFLLSGLGLIWGGISQVAQGVADWWTGVTEGQEYIIHPDDVADVMNYLHNMNYDLYGYGFVTNSESSGSGWTIENGSSGGDEVWDIEKTSKTVQDGNGKSVEIQTDGSGEIVLEENNYKSRSKGSDSDPTYNTFRYLQTYLVADNYSSLLKNGNKSVSATFAGFKDADTKFKDDLKNYFKGILVDDIEFGTGLISVYYEDTKEKDEEGKIKITGKKGNSVEGESVLLKFLPLYGAYEKLNIILGAHVNINNSKLVVSSGSKSNIKFKYDLDGWVGRYGMPLEFLLSVHLATMAPDLSYRLATSFDTDVQVLLHESQNSSVRAGVVLKNKDSITTTSNMIEFENMTDDQKNYFLESTEERKNDENKDKIDVEPIITKSYIDNVTDQEGKNFGEKLVDLFNLSPKDALVLFNQTPIVSPPGCLGPRGKYTDNKFWFDANLIEDIDSVADVDKKNLFDDNGNLDKISDVRQKIEAEIFKCIDDYITSSNGSDYFIDPNNMIVKEISMDDMRKVESGDMPLSQVALVEGDVENIYEIVDLDMTTTSSNVIKYFSDLPEAFQGRDGYGAGDTTEIIDGTLQKYIHDKIFNDIKTEDLVELWEGTDEDGNSYDIGISSTADQEGYPSECTRTKIDKNVSNKYNESLVSDDDHIQGHRLNSNSITNAFFYFHNDSWCIYNDYDNDFKDFIAPQTWYIDGNPDYGVRDWFVNIIWNSDLYNYHHLNDNQFNENDGIVIVDDFTSHGKINSNYKYSNKIAIAPTYSLIKDSYNVEKYEREEKYDVFSLPEAQNPVFIWDASIKDSYEGNYEGNTGNYRPMKPDGENPHELLYDYDSSKGQEYDIKGPSIKIETNNNTVYSPAFIPNSDGGYNEPSDVAKNKCQEDPTKLFKYTKKDEITEKKAFELLKFQGDKLCNYYGVDFYTYVEDYKTREVTGRVAKPILKKNDYKWNWSFVNEHKNDAGETIAYAFITISVSTDDKKHIENGRDENNNVIGETINLDSDLRAFNTYPVDNSETGYTINYGDQSQSNYNVCGQIFIDCTCKVITADEFINNKHDVFKTCSDIAKEASLDDIKNGSEVCCNVCHNYVKELYDALREMDNIGMTMYIPYINRVTDHWYRNVYFTKAALDDYNNSGIPDEKKEKNIIQIDDDYEKRTGERWTLYEMDGNDYKLYVLDSNNNYTDATVKKDKNGNYRLDEDGVTYRKIKDGEIGEYSVNGSVPDEFLVAKKPLNENALANLKNADDGSSEWLAYSSSPVKIDTGWKMLSVDTENMSDMNEKLSKLISKYEDLTLLTDQHYEGVKQIEEGIRGETNSKIKEIFLHNYYIYDGSKTRASIIQNFKMKNNSDDPDKVGDRTNKLPDMMNEEERGSKEIAQASIDEISGKINLNKDSLNAFAILKNMKTLDAEFIYHDFKELIVELNYFDKEDLLDGGKQVMMFPVAGINSTNWPIAMFDRDSSYYGTLIHSAQAYEELKTEKNIVEEKSADPLDGLTTEEKEKYQRKLTGRDLQEETFAETAQACWQNVVEHSPAYDVENKGIVPDSVHRFNESKLVCKMGFI